MHLFYPRNFGYAVSLMVFALFLCGFTQKGIESEQGYYLIDVESKRKQIRIGKNDMVIVFYDRKAKKPVSKPLSLEVIPWMATSEHSITELPVVEPQDNGRYHIQNIFFDREGTWQIYIRIDKGKKEDAVVFDVEVFE